jgi:hypothetical protein
VKTGELNSKELRKTDVGFGGFGNLPQGGGGDEPRRRAQKHKIGYRSKKLGQFWTFDLHLSMNSEKKLSFVAVIRSSIKRSLC